MRYLLTAFLLLTASFAHGTLHYRIDKTLPSGAEHVHPVLLDAEQGWIVGVYNQNELRAYPMVLRNGVFTITGAAEIHSFDEPIALYDVAQRSEQSVTAILGRGCGASKCEQILTQVLESEWGWQESTLLSLDDCARHPEFTDNSEQYVFNGCEQMSSPNSGEEWALPAGINDVITTHDGAAGLLSNSEGWALLTFDEFFVEQARGNFAPDGTPECTLVDTASLSVACLELGRATLWSWPDGVAGVAVRAELWESDGKAVQVQAYHDRLLWAIDEGDKTVITHTNLSGELYSVREVPSVSNARWWHSDGIAFYPAWQSTGKMTLSAFAYHDRDFAPQFINGGNAAIQSGQTYTREIKAFDEDTLRDDLVVTLREPPEWLSRDGQQISGAPSHSDLGEHTYTVVVAADEEAVEQDSVITVTLAPAEITFYSAPWFDAIGLDTDEPQPLAFLMAQLPSVQWAEDEAFTATLSVAAREASEATLAVEGLPAWLAYDAATRTLSGTPGQSDVAAFSLAVSMTDTYDAQGGEQTIMPWTVYEVDEPFTVTSTPVLSALAGEFYRYQLATDDEETDIDAMTITLGKAPSWIALGAGGVLSGVPSEDDVGVNRVQVVLTDAVGHAVVHTLDIDVTSALSEEERAGGSVSFAAIFLLVGGLYVRRRA